MKKEKRFLACFLALVLVATLLPAPVADSAGKIATYGGTSYSTDYTTWRQGDPAWGKLTIGDLHTMAGSGCLITSISILMCLSGAYSPVSFNPGVFRDWLEYKGYISHSSLRSADASLGYGNMTAVTSPRFYYVNQVWFTTTTTTADICSKIDSLQAKGYYVVARVKNSGHFVPVARTEGEDAVLYDPGYYRKSMLSDYNGTIGGLLYFRANTNGEDTILPLFANPIAPTVTALSSLYGDGDNISVSWKDARYATHYNVYVDAKAEKGTWTSNYKTYFYADSPFSLDALPAGEYRLKVQSANGHNWTYADSGYQTFTVKRDSCTVTYYANGGKVSVSSVLMTQGDLYDLPTPTLSGSAFLGWYTSGGALVTSSTKMTAEKAHTLTAKWSKTGVGFTRSATYQDTFQDINSSDWFYPSVASVYAYGFMNGTEPNQFSPSGEVTAAQAITLAARLNQLYLTGKGSFSGGSPWYQPYVSYAQKKKIITAVPKDLNVSITRADFAKMMAAALPEAALPAVNTVASGAIPDVSTSASYAAAVYRLYRAGVLGGRDASGSFLPDQPITRSEAAAALVRIADPNLRVLFTMDKS